MSDEQDILAQINATASQPAGQPAPAGSPAPAGHPGAGSFWDQGAGPGAALGGPVNTGQQAAAAGSDMLAAAKAGHFAVEPEYAKRLIKGLNDELNKLNGMSRQLDMLNQGTKIGTTPAALKVAPFYLEQVATTGPHAFVRNHYLGIQALTDMVQAIQVAMGNYRTTDDGTAGHFKHLG